MLCAPRWILINHFQNKQILKREDLRRSVSIVSYFEDVARCNPLGSDVDCLLWNIIAPLSTIFIFGSLDG